MPLCYLYIIECLDGTFYTGVANDYWKRYLQHKSGHGALYTKQHGVKFVRYVEKHPSKSLAMRRERQIKRMSHNAKRELMKGVVE